MAYYTIQKRESKKGVRYRCIVRFSGDDGKEKSQSKTFGKKAEAEAWGKREVAAIEKNGTLGSTCDVKLFDLLYKYLNDPHVEIGRTKRYSLKLIADCSIAQIKLDQLRPKHIVDFAKDRKGAGACPATVNVDVSNLRSVLKHANSLYGFAINEKAIVDAVPTLKALKLIGKSERRSRRPTSNELDQIRDELALRQQKSPKNIPFLDILDFSIFTCMRIGEVCSIEWKDFDPNENYVWVWNRKDPRKQEGNHMKVPLVKEALEIIRRQSKTDDPRIFPFNSRTITAAFQRVRNKLGIKDLRYHDLRREGASRLFEKGYDIHQVAQMTGHREMNTLWQVYTELNPKDFIEID